jgi:hypothetical protein
MHGDPRPSPNLSAEAVLQYLSDQTRQQRGEVWEVNVRLADILNERTRQILGTTEFEGAMPDGVLPNEGMQNVSTGGAERHSDVADSETVVRGFMPGSSNDSMTFTVRKHAQLPINPSEGGETALGANELPNTEYDERTQESQWRELGGSALRSAIERIGSRYAERRLRIAVAKQQEQVWREFPWEVRMLYERICTLFELIHTRKIMWGPGESQEEWQDLQGRLMAFGYVYDPRQGLCDLTGKHTFGIGMISASETRSIL